MTNKILLQVYVEPKLAKKIRDMAKMNHDTTAGFLRRLLYIVAEAEEQPLLGSGIKTR